MPLCAASGKDDLFFARQPVLNDLEDPLSRGHQGVGPLAALFDQRNLALLECLDVGKPISDTTGVDVPSAVRTILRSMPTQRCARRRPQTLSAWQTP